MERVKKVYICTPLKPGKFNLDIIQKAILKECVFAFIPPTEEKNDMRQGSQVDKLHIDMCDELWAFGPLGHDCAREIGYARGRGKRVVLFADDSNRHVVQNNWMLFCAGTVVKGGF